MCWCSRFLCHVKSPHISPIGYSKYHLFSAVCHSVVPLVTLAMLSRILNIFSKGCSDPKMLLHVRDLNKSHPYYPPRYSLCTTSSHRPDSLDLNVCCSRAVCVYDSLTFCFTFWFASFFLPEHWFTAATSMFAQRKLSNWSILDANQHQGQSCAERSRKVLDFKT